MLHKGTTVADALSPWHSDATHVHHQQCPQPVSRNTTNLSLQLALKSRPTVQHDTDKLFLIGSSILLGCTLLKGVVHLQRDGVEANTAAAAEELIAEEAHEAAQAAAKKVKKKKAKARKQQARSDATSASALPPASSEASTAASLQAHQDVGPKPTSEQSSPSGTKGCEMPPDQHAAGLQIHLQHTTMHDFAMPSFCKHAAEDEPVFRPAAADVGFCAGSAMADNVQTGNAAFLQLFTCPITQVLTR